MISEMEKQHPFILIVFSSHSRILTSAFHDIFLNNAPSGFSIWMMWCACDILQEP